MFFSLLSRLHPGHVMAVHSRMGYYEYRLAFFPTWVALALSLCHAKVFEPP